MATAQSRGQDATGRQHRGGHATHRLPQLLHLGQGAHVHCPWQPQGPHNVGHQVLRGLGLDHHQVPPLLAQADVLGLHCGGVRLARGRDGVHCQGQTRHAARGEHQGGLRGGPGRLSQHLKRSVVHGQGVHKLQDTLGGPQALCQVPGALEQGQHRQLVLGGRFQGPSRRIPAPAPTPV